MDGGTPARTATTMVTVLVERNENAPVFNPTSYVKSIADTTAVGSSILQLSAADNDQVYPLQF